MPRFLTPTRLCLLSLINTYIQGNVLSSEANLPVLEFIASNVVASSQYHIDEANTQQDKVAPASDLSSWASKALQLPSSRPGRSVYDVLLSEVWSLRGLDMLHDLVACVNNALAAPGGHRPTSLAITPASPIGQLIRRCSVEFMRLHFADTQALWNALQAYREPTFKDWSARHPDQAAEYLAGDPLRDILLPNTQTDIFVSADLANASTTDANTLLTFAIHRLQKLGMRIPQEVKSQLEKWFDYQWESSTQTTRFFMNFFEHWRAGQYTMALESLHRYFDYSVASNKTSTESVKVFYQYALLHLSVLHADFECWDESIEAMNECIVTARENNDAACLHFALSWLVHLRQAYPGSGSASFGAVSKIVGSSGGEQDEINFLKTKSKEGRHWLLLSSTLLEEAKLTMYSGGPANKAQESILQAMYLNVQHDLKTMLPAASLFSGATLERIGQSHLATGRFKLAGSIFSNQCPLNEKVRSLGRVAQNLTQAGFYARALDLIHETSTTTKGVLKLEQRITAFSGLVQLKRQLHRGDLDAASYHLTQLQPLQSFGDPETVSEIHLLEIELLLKQHAFETAFTKVSERLAEMKGPRSDFARRLHLLVLRSRIFAAGGQASKGFTIALRATSTAERHCLIPTFLEGMLVVSGILTDLAEFTAARDMLASTLPHALETNNAYLIARLFVALGEAHVGIAGHACENNSVQQAHNMRTAEEYIERGRNFFERVEDLAGMLECLVMKSRIATWAGDEASASQADDMYMQLLADYQAGVDG